MVEHNALDDIHGPLSVVLCMTDGEFSAQVVHLTSVARYAAHCGEDHGGAYNRANGEVAGYGGKRGHGYRLRRYLRRKCAAGS